jgi:hypothetical protein
MPPGFSRTVRAGKWNHPDIGWTKRADTACLACPLSLTHLKLGSDWVQRSHTQNCLVPKVFNNILPNAAKVAKWTEQLMATNDHSLSLLWFFFFLFFIMNKWNSKGRIGHTDVRKRKQSTGKKASPVAVAVGWPKGFIKAGKKAKELREKTQVTSVAE